MKAKQVFGGLRRGQWYVSTGDGWHYLHSDGVVRFSTLGSGTFSGFFLTEAEANAAIAAYEAKQRKDKP